MTEYVDTVSGAIISHRRLQRQARRYKAGPFSAEELEGTTAAVLVEPAVPGDAPTGKAILTGGGWVREYRPFSAAELEQNGRAGRKAAQLAGVEFGGVMCSATADDMFGLASVKPYVEAGQPINYYFDNGTVLQLTPQNIAAFEAVWLPFRQSFFP